MLDLQEYLAENLDYRPQWTTTVWQKFTGLRHTEARKLAIEREFAYDKKPRPPRTKTGFNSHITPEEALTIRKRVSAGEKMIRLAEEYKVHKSTITRIIQGKSYRNL